MLDIVPGIGEGGGGTGEKIIGGLKLGVSLVWQPALSITNSKANISTVQKKMTRFITSTHFPALYKREQGGPFP